MGFSISEAGHIGLTPWYIALAYHNAQLQASAFREQFDPDSFEDLTEPKVGSMHKVCFSIHSCRDLVQGLPCFSYVVLFIESRKFDEGMENCHCRGRLGELRCTRDHRFETQGGELSPRRYLVCVILTVAGAIRM
jgi:hypothetical protein